MKLLNPYISYIGSIKPDICEKIISLGLSKIETNKKKGIKTTATTINDKQKKINDSERNKVLENVIASDKIQLISALSISRPLPAAPASSE